MLVGVGAFEYLATPDLTDKVLIIADPMLATGISMEMGMKAFLTKGNPKHIHIACVLAAPEGIEHIKKTFPEDKTTIWCASIDEGLNERTLHRARLRRRRRLVLWRRALSRRLYKFVRFIIKYSNSILNALFHSSPFGQKKYLCLSAFRGVKSCFLSSPTRHFHQLSSDGFRIR